VGGFQVIEPIAKGGMGTIYRGRDGAGNLDVAIKLITREHSERYDYRDQKNRRQWEAYRFLKGITWEGEILLNLNHPHIVQTYEIGKQDGQYYIIMELLPPRNLHELSYSRSERLKGRRLKVVYQFAHAILHTHRMGIIHRDVCPRNVLLDDEGRAKLIDYGLAIPKLEKLKDVFHRSGTPSYMAPEVVRSDHYDFRTDIYAFGVSMYEIFVGKPPFAGEDQFDRAAQHLGARVVPPRETNPRIPKELEAIILRALEKDPDSRYQSMEDVVQALGRLVRATSPSPTETTEVLLQNDPRRIHGRIRDRCYLHYYQKSWVSRGAKQVAVTDNISTGGVSFRVREPPEAGTALQMEIQPRAATSRIRVDGKVVHLGKTDAVGLTPMGVEFVSIPRKDRENFRRYIQERQANRVPFEDV
jgi:serine/threonine protein kinase